MVTRTPYLADVSGPLFAILGNVFTAPLRWVTLEPATAASLYATA